MKNKKLSVLLNTPLGLLIVLSSLIAGGELLIMTLAQDIFVPAIVSEEDFGFIDTILLTLIVGPILYFLVFRKLQEDIAERERTAIKLQAGEQRLHTLVDTIVDGIIVIDANGCIQNFNPAAEALFGYAADEVQGQNVKMLMPQPYAGGHDGYIHDYLTTGKKKIIGIGREVVGKRKDGSTFPMDLAVSEMRTGGESLFIGIARDITERKRIAEQVVTLSTRLRLATESAGVGIWDWDVARNQLSWDKTMCELYGVGLESFEGAYEAWQSGLHPEDAERVKEKIRLALGDEQSFDSEFRVVWPGGEVRWLKAMATVQRDETSAPLRMIGTNWDITESKQAEQALIAARDEAERASLAKSHFLASMSHELRTPMNAVLGFAQLMGMNANLPVEHKQSVGEILKAGHHLLGLINQVLSLAKIESGNIELAIEAVDCNEVVGECLALTTSQADALGIRVDSADFSGIVLRADRMRLKQVLLNLLSNAVKYNRPGGSVKLDCSSDDACLLRIMVSDTGTGIPPERLGEVFQPFNRLGAEGGTIEGTGIGLTISKQLMELMGGGIGAESTPGTGSTFWIELPLETGRVAAFDSGAEAANAQFKVLYVDDNLSNLKQLNRLLSQRPHIRLVTTHSPQIGIDLAGTHPFDLILLDINMPDMNGFEVLAQLRERGLVHDTPVVAITANDTSRDIERGLAAGFAEYVTKPIDVDRFFRVLDHCLKTPPRQQQ